MTISKILSVAFFTVVIGIVGFLFLFSYTHQAAKADQDNYSFSDYYKIILGEEEADQKKEAPPLNIPLIKQLPELPRGCEVTSLAMLLNSSGLSISKLKLAKEVKKDPTPYKRANGKVYFGNPNTGFVGDMYSFSNPGLGVYHGPVFQLTRKYLGDRALEMSGSPFSRVEKQLRQKRPVWVIISINFKKVPASYWSTWQTPTGKIKVTRKEHSVLLTGYDEKYVYFNDPLGAKGNKRALKKPFIEAWKQFGSQAISYE